MAECSFHSEDGLACGKPATKLVIISEQLEEYYACDECAAQFAEDKRVEVTNLEE